MKALIAALLLSLSSVALADNYYFDNGKVHSTMNPPYYPPMASNFGYIDMARYRKFQEEQYEANYKAMRQHQLDRRDDERFISDYREPSTPLCVYKSAMSDEEIRRCNQ
jgi:hypothetical protein